MKPCKNRIAQLKKRGKIARQFRSIERCKRVIAKNEPSKQKKLAIIGDWCYAKMERTYEHPNC